LLGEEKTLMSKNNNLIKTIKNKAKAFLQDVVP